MSLLEFLGCFIAYGGVMLGSCALFLAVGGWLGSVAWMVTAAVAHYYLFGG